MGQPFFSSRAEQLRLVAGIGSALAVGGCDVFDAQLEKRVAAESGPRECNTHADCGPDIACTRDYRCVPLENEFCIKVVGDLNDPNAIVLGTMFSLTGPQAMTNLPRAQSAALAIEAINAVGGVPGMGASKRPLVLVQCDEIGDLDAAASHLIEQLKVPAIVGPNLSQDVITVSNKYSIEGGTVLISPTAVASSITDLVDMDLTWQFVPSDEARAPLMRQQVAELEEQLDLDRPTRLSIIYRDDALGMGTRESLNNLMLNGKSLTENLNDRSVTIEPYAADDVEGRAAIAARQVAFAPDIVVMAGLAEAITQVMDPLEDGWKAPHRPQYVLIDSLKVPELLTSASKNSDLRKRVRGTGIVPAAESEQVYAAFQVDYLARYPNSATTISGMGPSYDAAFAIGFALAATRDQPISGASIAAGLRKLGGPGNDINVQPSRTLAAFGQLSMGNSINAIGTFAPLQFDDRGAPESGRVEIWCIRSGTPPQYASSGRGWDIDDQSLYGEYTACD